MAQTSENGQQSTLGCNCLNILLTQGNPPGDQRHPKLKESGLTWVYVGEDGIRVKFPGATSRERITRLPSSKPGVGFEETQTVKCLFCGTLVYRVRIDQSSEASNSKYVVEDAALKSIDGWVQIFSKNCLKTEAIRQAMESTTYSSTLSLCLPKSDSTPLTTSRITDVPLPDRIMPDLPSFVKPPPFTPSHPAYLVLAKVATQASNELRAKAETEVMDFLKQRIHSLDQAETRIRIELNTAWQLFKDGYKDDLEGDIGTQSGPSHASTSRAPPRQARTVSKSSSNHRPVKQSLLSSSLSTNAMHYEPPQRAGPTINEESNLDSDAFGNDAALKDEAVSFQVLESQLHDARAKAAHARPRKLATIEEVGRGHAPQSAPVSAFRRVVSNPEPGSPASQEKRSKRKVTFNAEPAIRTIEPVKVKPPPRREFEGQMFEIEGLESPEGRHAGPLHQTQEPKPAITRRKPSSPPSFISSVTPFAQSYKNSVFAALRPKSLPTFEIPIRTSSPALLESSLELDDGTDLSDEAGDEVDYLPLDDTHNEISIDLGPSSLPIPTNPLWETLEKPRKPSRRLNSIQETDENGHLAEYALASTAPTARTFHERTEELLHSASKPETKLRSQKAVRQRIYNQLDRQRHVDPGAEYDGDEVSDTDTESIANANI